ncbi:MAG: acetylxylan esterase [Bryobacteraceae bacterium]
MMRRIRTSAALLITAFASIPFGGIAAGAEGIPWDVVALERAPRVFDAPHQNEPGVKSVWFEGPMYKGKPTRVFAYYGAPEGRNLPAMVLIHGGGGTAFAEWVRMWNGRGYAAIAMDTCGAVPERAVEGKAWNPERKRHEYSGPAGWGGFDRVEDPPEDQWSYHAVSAAILAHSLLRSMPEVDGRRVGVTGISWGGYLTSIVSSLDSRFRFAAPVYGCGFLGEDSAWIPQFEKLGPELAGRWLRLWDPSRYLGRSKTPTLWVNGTNDFAYPLVSWQKSYRATRGQRTLTVRVRMKHNHPDGASPEEIHRFADAMVRKGTPLARITGQGEKGGRAWVRFRSERPIVRAELNYTRDGGAWKDRAWETTPAAIEGKSASAAIPSGARVLYLNLYDDRNLVVSSEHVEVGR